MGRLGAFFDAEFYKTAARRPDRPAADARKGDAEKTEALLASIVQSSDDAILSIDQDYIIQTWNKKAEVLFGYSPEEIIGRHISVLAPPELHEEITSTGSKLRTGAGARYETVRVGKGGRRIQVAAFVSPIIDKSGEVVGASAFYRDIDSRLESERRLRASEERFRGVFEQAPSGICVTARDGRLLQVNEALCRLLGYTEEELLSATWAELMHPDDFALSQELVTSLLDDPTTRVEAERRYIHCAGHVVSARVRMSAMRVQETGQIFFIVHLEDITEQKRAESALQESEERFRSLADGCPTMMWVTDAEGDFRFANETCRQFFGVRVDELCARKWRPVLHPDDASRYFEAFDESIEQRTPFRAEARIRRADGEWRWVGSYAKPRFSASGEFLGHAGLTADITERLKAEQAIQASEEKFRQLAENIRELFWMWDVEDNKAAYLSPACEQVWGIKPEDLEQNPRAWIEAVHPDDQETAQSFFARHITGESVDTNYRIRRRDGVERWIRDRAFPIRDRSGRVIRVAGIAEDITERKQHEEQLLEAQRQALAANLAKSRLLANMSHEIRTPMNGVLGMAQLLASTELSADQRKYLGVIQTSGKALLALIDDILDFSKIEAGKITLERVDFDVHALLHDFHQLWTLQATSKGLSFRSNLAGGVPSQLKGDPNRLLQILNNLAANAVKFTERGEVALEVALESALNGGATLRFSITDSGIGIRPEQAALLFSPFVQADASTTRRYGGTGLGLAISKQLAELMGGRIGLQSEEGHGSTFWFTAAFEAASPAEPSALVNGQPASTPFAAGQSPAERHGREPRMLVAEDNPTNRLVAIAQLKKLGYAADAVANGAEAISALQQKHYDIVLMDCEMPVMDGYEATRRLRAANMTELPIIALTAHAMSSNRDRCLQEGMSDFLTKPVDLHQLAAVLDRWLRLPQPAPAAAAPAAAADQPSPFDAAALLQRLMDDREIAAVIVTAFVEDFPSQVSTVRTCIDEGDARSARVKAHALKGSAASVSADRISTQAFAIEKAAGAGDLEACRRDLPGLAEAFEEFKQAVARTDWI
jgi:PAS domain S-box-containing protein